MTFKVPVSVKVETFTCTKYEMLEGEAINASDNAIEDEQRGLIYSTRIRLPRDQLDIKGVSTPLKSWDASYRRSQNGSAASD